MEAPLKTPSETPAVSSVLGHFNFLFSIHVRNRKANCAFKFLVLSTYLPKNQTLIKKINLKITRIKHQTMKIILQKIKRDGKKIKIKS